MEIGLGEPVRASSEVSGPCGDWIRSPDKFVHLRRWQKHVEK